MSLVTSCSCPTRRLWRKVFDYGIYIDCRSFDGQAYIGTPSGVIRCRTVRQLSAQERWDTELELSIKGTLWSPDGERAGDVNIRVDLPESRVTEVRIRQRSTHQSFPGERASPQRRSTGLVLTA